MNIKQPDHTTYREWLYLESDGELKAGERSGLQQHLAGCQICRQERRELSRLNQLLEESRIPVAEELAAQVMAHLPATGWESRSPRTWLAALAVAVLLAVGSVLLIGGASEDVLTAAPVAAAAAVWELLSASALAGAGLLAASWKGLGIAFQDALAQSVWNIVAFGVLILFLDLLLFRLLFRRRTAGAEAEDRSQD